MRLTRHTKKLRAFTLTEVMVAMLVFAILAIAMTTTAMFSLRITRLNTNSIAAKNIAQGFFERMAIDEFANVNPPANAVFAPTNGGYADIADDAADPVWLDEALGIPCAVDFEFKGYGRATAGTGNSLTDATAEWETDEWAGDVLYIVDGRGAGQFATITSNTGDTLTLAGNLAFSPDNSTRYMINNGKTVEITTRWTYLGREYSQTIESLVVNYRGANNIGF